MKSVSKEGRETRTGEIVIPWVGKVRFGRTMGDEMNNGINGLEGERGREGRKTVTVNGRETTEALSRSFQNNRLKRLKGNCWDKKLMTLGRKFHADDNDLLSLLFEFEYRSFYLFKVILADRTKSKTGCSKNSLDERKRKEKERGATMGRDDAAAEL